MLTEFAREVLAQRGVKLVVPGEREGERVVASLTEETDEADVQTEQKNGAEAPTVNALVGERCEVRRVHSKHEPSFKKANPGRKYDFFDKSNVLAAGGSVARSALLMLSGLVV